MIFILLLVLATGIAGFAQDLGTAPSRVGIGITQKKMSLDDAIRMAIANNLEVEIERTNRDTARQAIEAAKGLFDPTFRWQPLFQTLNTPTGSVLQGSSGKLTDRALNQNFYLRHRLMGSGTQLNADFENSRQTTTNPFTSFSPLLTSRLAFGFTQPLFRGRLLDRDRAEIRIRQRRADGASVDLEQRTIDIVTRVEQAYWDLVAARQAVVVSNDAAGLATEQLAINERLVKSGTLAPVELSAAQAELQRRLDTWYGSVGVVTEVENNLKSLLTPNRTDQLWGDEIIPTDDQLLQEPPTGDLAEAVKQAIKTRPELRSLQFRRQINDVETDLNKDLQKPVVNLIGQYSLNGLGGSLLTGDNPFSNLNAGLYQQVNLLSAAAGIAPLQPPVFGNPPDFLVGSYGTALNNLFRGRYQSFQVGLSLDLNLRNRTANANYAQTRIAEKRLQLERSRAEQLIEAQVRNALQGIQTARQRITAAEASAKAAKEKLDSETRLYQSGESTNFLVLTRQNEYSDSRRRTVVARLDFNKSVSRLSQSLGSTLSGHKITLQ